MTSLTIVSNQDPGKVHCATTACPASVMKRVRGISGEVHTISIGRRYNMKNNKACFVKARVRLENHSLFSRPRYIMDILDLGFLLFLSQDFVPKEAQANNGCIKGEMLPGSFARTRLSKIS